MSEKKMVALVNRLTEKTEQGLLVWQEAAMDRTFFVAFPNYSVGISEDAGGRNYAIQIVDSEGKTIDSADDQHFELEDFGEAPEEYFRSLYIAARRGAMGIDVALNEILGELE